MNLLFWRSRIPGLKRISFHCRKCSSAKKYARITCQILSYKFFRFVLYQLSKNLNRPFFMDFLTQLSIRYTEKSAVVDEEDPDDQGEEIKCVCFWTMWWVHSLYLTVWSGFKVSTLTFAQILNSRTISNVATRVYQQICFLVIWILVQFQKCLFVLNVICYVQIMDKMNLIDATHFYWHLIGLILFLAAWLSIYQLCTHIFISHDISPNKRYNWYW